MPNLDLTQLLPTEILDTILGFLTPSDVRRVVILAQHLRSVALKHEFYYHEVDWHIDPNVAIEVKSRTERLLAASRLGLPLSVRLSIDEVDDDEVSRSDGRRFAEALAECMPKITALTIETEDERAFQLIIDIIAQRPAARLRTFRSRYNSPAVYRADSLRRSDTIWPTIVFAGVAPLLKIFDIQGFNGPSGLQPALTAVQDVHVRCVPRISDIAALAKTFPGSKNWTLTFENPNSSSRARNWGSPVTGILRHVDMPSGLTSISLIEDGLRTDNVFIAAIMRNFNCTTYRSIRLPFTGRPSFDLVHYTSGFPAPDEGLLFVMDSWNIHPTWRTSVILISLISSRGDGKSTRSRIFQTVDSPLDREDGALDLFRGFAQQLVRVVIPHEYLPHFLAFATEMPVLHDIRVTLKYFRQVDVDERFWPPASRDVPVPPSDTLRFPQFCKLEVAFGPDEWQAERADDEGNPPPAPTWMLRASQLAILARELGLHHLPPELSPILELVKVQLERDEGLTMFSSILIDGLAM